MKTIIFPNNGPNRYMSGPVLMNVNTMDVKDMESHCTNIDSIYVAPEDCEVRYYKDNKPILLKASKGDLIITFYKRDYIKHYVIVIKNNEFKENLNSTLLADQINSLKMQTCCGGDCNGCCNCNNC